MIRHDATDAAPRRKTLEERVRSLEEANAGLRSDLSAAMDAIERQGKVLGILSVEVGLGGPERL